MYVHIRVTKSNSILNTAIELPRILYFTIRCVICRVTNGEIQYTFMKFQLQF
nr:MAG TPA: hypothetical protein [Caudoviricetes sp.]